jgi:hypothetical protein
MVLTGLSTVSLVGAATFTVIAIVAFVCARSRKVLAALSGNTLRTLDHTSAGLLIGGLVDWWRIRLVSMGAGQLLGVIVSGACIWQLGLDRAGQSTPIVLMGGLAGTVIGAGASGFLRPNSRKVGPRVASLTRVALRDFVPAGVRVVAALAVVVSILMVGATILFSLWSERYQTSPIIPVPALILTIVALVAWLVFEVGGRWVVARSAASRDKDELAADGILRSLSVRDMANSATLLGAVATIMTLPDLLLALDSSLPTIAATQGLMTGLAIATLIATVFFVFTPARIQPLVVDAFHIDLSRARQA